MDRYEPKKNGVAYRCQFRYRKREKEESASDYGYHLNRLAQKAYPILTLNQLEVPVIDQFITGCHPKLLYEATGLATEYDVLVFPTKASQPSENLTLKIRWIYYQ